MKKLLLVFFGLVISISIFNFDFLSSSHIALAVEGESIETSITDSTKQQLESLELTEFENLYEEYKSSDKTLNQLIQDIIDGKISLSFNDLVSIILSKAQNMVKNILYTILLLLSISILSGLISNFSSANASIKNLLNIVFVCLSATILIYFTISSVTETAKTIRVLGDFSKIVFPVLIVLVTATGAKTSSVMYQPLVATLSTGIIAVFSGVVMTTITIYMILTILNNLVKDVKLNKLIEFFASFLKWIIGLSFGIFFTYSSIVGLVAGGKDGISIKTAKYAIKSYVPIVGGYLSDGFEIFRAGSIVLKNSIGVVGLLLLLVIILTPAIKLLVTNLLLKFTSGLAELSGDKSISNLMNGMSKVFNYLLATIMTVFMMCFILILLIVMTANMV